MMQAEDFSALVDRYCGSQLTTDGLLLKDAAIVETSVLVFEYSVLTTSDFATDLSLAEGSSILRFDPLLLIVSDLWDVTLISFAVSNKGCVTSFCMGRLFSLPSRVFEGMDISLIGEVGAAFCVLPPQPICTTPRDCVPVLILSYWA